MRRPNAQGTPKPGIRNGTEIRILELRNFQRICAVDVRLLRQVVRSLLQDLLHAQNFQLSVQLIDAIESTRLNETFLRHKGPTDVIAFDYSGETGCANLYGEIFICAEEAVRQARRFRTTWQSELVRYIVHGILHLSGYNDRRTVQRRRMKRAENRLLRRLADIYVLRELAAKRTGQKPNRAANDIDRRS